MSGRAVLHSPRKGEPPAGTKKLLWEESNLSGRAELRSPRKGEPPAGTKKLLWEESNLSGRADLNRRPLRPERSALTGLSHAPNKPHLVGQARRDYTRPYPIWQAVCGIIRPLI